MITKNVQQRQTHERRWLVRDEQGGVFGPVAFETLKEWAQDGRLAPTSMVSEDASVWSPVTHLHGLGMDWVAETSPGVFYGPIHHQALEGLLKDGTLTTSAVLFARNSRAGAVPPRGERQGAEGEALAACVEQAERAQALLTAQVAQLTAELAERDARLQRVEQQAADAGLLQLLSRQIVVAQEVAAQQVLDAVAGVSAAVEGQGAAAQRIQAMVAGVQAAVPRALAPELARGREALARQVLDALPGVLGSVLAEGRQVVLEALAGVQPQTAGAVEGVVRREAAAVAQEVRAGQEQVGDAVAAVARQVQELSEGMRALELAVAAGQKTAPAVERVYVEAEAVEVIPPAAAAHGQQHKPTPPEPAEVARQQGARKSGGKGLSMAELEQQAQRELERLGAQGVNLFKRKS